ncbi:MAG: ribonuclease PH [Candidatus Babeliales bacterium]
MPRSYKRTPDQVRPLKITKHVAGNADGSVLLELGKTKVICTASLANTTPHFLRNKDKWWLTASYNLLPASAQTRVERESIAKRNERSVEISRLIGRSLRSIVSLHDMGSEKTIYIDCDVLQADGSTRCASITGAFVALQLAEQKWLSQGIIKQPFIQDELVAVSCGILDGTALVDIDYAEDSNGVADFNFVMTRSGNIIEIQGSAEQKPIAWNQVALLATLAHKGIQDIFAFLDNQDTPVKHDKKLQVSLKELLQSQ